MKPDLQSAWQLFWWRNFPPQTQFTLKKKIKSCPSKERWASLCVLLKPSRNSHQLHLSSFWFFNLWTAFGHFWFISHALLAIRGKPSWFSRRFSKRLPSKICMASFLWVLTSKKLKISKRLKEIWSSIVVRLSDRHRLFLIASGHRLHALNIKNFFNQVLINEIKLNES